MPLGAWLRRERERRSWSRPEMARRLIRVAEGNGDYTTPGIGNITHNLYRWERSTVTPGERYRLYFCEAFGIPLDQFGVLKNEFGVLRTTSSESSRTTLTLPISSSKSP